MVYLMHRRDKSASPANTFYHKTLVIDNTFGKILLVKASTLSPNTPKILDFSPKKIWNSRNYNKFIVKALQLSSPKKVWTALSIA
jgi:hypothetical protein